MIRILISGLVGAVGLSALIGTYVILRPYIPKDSQPVADSIVSAPTALPSVLLLTLIVAVVLFVTRLR